MIANTVVLALLAASVTLATPIPASSSGSSSRRSSGGSHASSRTSMSTHNQAQAQHQQHQQQQHHVHVVNAVHNQAWNPPAHQNPVNLQPLHVAQPAQRRRPRPSSGCGLSCTVMKKRALEAMELAARSFEALEARGLDELD